MLDIVLFEALIVLFVSVFEVPENRVSNWDNNTLPSVPPSDNNILSPFDKLILFKKSRLLKGFSFAMILGVILGTYSSIYIANPILIFLRVSQKTLIKEEN